MHHKFAFAAYNILMPYPGTPLYNRLQAESRLLYGGKWWLHPEYRFNHAAFIPKNMTPDELTEACWECRAQVEHVRLDMPANVRSENAFVLAGSPLRILAIQPTFRA